MRMSSSEQTQNYQSRMRMQLPSSSDCSGLVVFNLGGRELFLEGSGLDILCTQLYYICFIRVLDGGRWVIVGCYNGSWSKKG